jgi:hypothetical protein
MKLILSLLLLAINVWPAAAADGLSWQSKPGSTALLQSNQVVWQFNFGPRESKPCFDPVAVPGGPALTWYSPPDHPWHRALWFSWKYINGVNYWEENVKTGLAAGRTEWSRPELVQRPDFSARVTLDLTYRPAEGKPVLTEHRVIEITPPDQHGVYHQDWTLTFTALGTDALLDRTPPPAGSAGAGGYAGLSVRLARDLEDVRVLSTEGPIQFAAGRFRGKASAMDYAGAINGREIGLAILDHPENLNAPSPWYAINEKTMHFFTPAVICFQPHTLKAGARLTLRYRVMAHPGRWDAARLGAELKRYSGSRD